MRRQTTKHGRRYDWGRIFGNRIVTLRRDVDYNGLEHSFVVYVRRAARKFGYRISVSPGDRSVTITVHGKKKPYKKEW